MAASTPLMAQVHMIIRRTIHQYYVNQAVKQGHPREQVQAGSVTFVQRFGSSINLTLHDHLIVLEGSTGIVPLRVSSRSLSSSLPQVMLTLPLSSRRSANG
jgi:hypothetical protein